MPERYFATEREGDPLSAAGQAMRDIEYDIFSRYAEPGAVVEDFELECQRIASAVGRSVTWAENGILGYSVLADLPRLRAMQETTRRLDLTRICAIESALNRLNDLATPETLAEFDNYLVKVFTPRAAGVELPSPTSLKRRLRDRIKQIDSKLAPDSKKIKDRRKAKDEPFGTCQTMFYGQDDGDAGLSISGDAATIGLMDRYVAAVAKEYKLTQDETIQQLLTGQINADVQLVLYAFAPKTPGSGYYVPGFGWTGAEGSEALDALVENGSVKVVDLDDAEHATTDAYVPTEAMKAYVQARDGSCRWPGCNVAAERCQLDHRIPHGDGGETTASNLFCLCQRHHNIKTDRRAVYLVDHISGDVVWLFADGTYQVAEPDGFLVDYLEAEGNPRWKSTLEQRRARRKDNAEFYARCHSAVEQYEKDYDWDECMATIKTLEDKFGRTFEYPPEKMLDITPEILASYRRHLEEPDIYEEFDPETQEWVACKI